MLDPFLYLKQIKKKSSAWQLGMENLEFGPGKKGAASDSGLFTVSSKHVVDLKPGDVINSNIDLKKMDLAGETRCGRMLHDEFALSAQPYSQSFRLKPIFY